jgi:hypothetical protein
MGCSAAFHAIDASNVAQTVLDGESASVMT